MEKIDILDQLHYGRIASFVLGKDNKFLIVTEQCDQCFIEKLSKEDVRLMIEELSVIHEKMVD